MLLAVFVLTSHGGVPPATLTVVREGNRAGIQWDAAAWASYRVQTALDPAGPWETQEVTATTNAGPIRWMAPESLRERRYYRVAMPQPLIRGVEPAAADLEGTTEVFILGECLPANGAVEIAGVRFPATLINTGGVWAVIQVSGLPPNIPEADVSVVDLDTGEMVAVAAKLFSVTGQPSPVGEATRWARYESPVCPPAAPFRARIPGGGKSTNGGGLDDDCDGLAQLHNWPGDWQVLPFSGEFQLRVIDLHIAGRGLDFVWTRTYRSRTGTNTAMGHNWAHSYDVSVRATPAGMAVSDGTGRTDVYYPGTNGVYWRREFFNEGRLSNEVFTLTFPSAGRWVFHPLNGSPTAGKLAQIIDRNQNSIRLDYDSSGRLIEIVDTLGRTNKVAYQPDGLVLSVTDFSGRTVSYSYHNAGGTEGGPGDLAGVTSPVVAGTPTKNDFPFGKTTRYTYSTGQADERLNHNLTSITDPAGQTWLRVAYHGTSNPADVDFDAVSHTQRGVEKKDIRRGMVIAKPSSRYAVIQAIENDGAGNVTELFFDSRNRPVILREFTGRANPELPTTQTENRPKAPLRSTDPAYFETAWEWTLDSLCKREHSARGDISVFFYESEYNPDAAARKRGDLRLVRQISCCGDTDSDGDGVPDLSERVWRMEYDARFGSPALTRYNHRQDWRTTRKGWDGTIKGMAFDGDNTPIIRGGRKGWDGTVKGSTHFARALNRKAEESYAPWECEDEFTTMVMNPLLAVSTADYDAAGNCVRQGHFGYLLDGSDAPVTGFAYNAHGQLTAVTNAPDSANRRRIDTASYFASGPQTGFLQACTVDAGGLNLTTSFEWDARGNLVRCVDPRGHDTLGTWNALDQLVRCESPVNLLARCKTDHYYDANENIVQTTVEVLDETDKPTGATIDVRLYDALDRCIEHTAAADEGLFITNRFAYDALDNLAAILSPVAVEGTDPHATVSLQYDERNLLFRRVRAPGSPDQSTDQFDYDATGRSRFLRAGLESADGPAVTEYEYDGFGRCVRTRDAFGNVEVRAFDATGNLVYERRDGETVDVPGESGNRALSETRYQYDSLNRCVAMIGSFFDVFTELPLLDGTATTRFSFAPNGACHRITDDNNHPTHYGYDTAGRLTTVTDAKTNITALVYDPNGNVLSIQRTDRPDSGAAEQVFVVTRIYDALNRCVAESDNVGNTNRFHYDSLNNLARCTDAQGNDTCFKHDLLSRRVATLSYVGPCDAGAGITINTTHVEYDANSRRVASVDGNGHRTTYAYDALDRCVAVVHPDKTINRLIWSPRSNLVGQEDPNGTSITNQFDLLDRCVRRDIAPGPGVAATTTWEIFAYDGLSRCVLASNNVSRIEISHDSLGGRDKVITDGWQMLQARDGVGNLITLTLPSLRTMHASFDPLAHLASLSTSPGGGLPAAVLGTVSYDGPGRPARLARANGVNTRLTWNGLNNPPNAPGDFGWRQVSGVNHQLANGGPVIDRRNAAYDRNQNRALRSQLTPWVAGGPLSTNAFSYDALNRLQGSVRQDGDLVRITEYALDPQGNRVAVTADGMALLYERDATLPEPADFQVDQYTATPSGQQLYDRNGNLVLRSTPGAEWHYRYDYADRLVHVEATAGPALASIASFSYDALGRRITRTVYPPAPLAPVTTRFIHAPDSIGDGILEEREDGQLKRTHVMPHVFETKNGGNYRTHVIPHVFETKNGGNYRTHVVPHVFETRGGLASFLINEQGQTLFPLADDLGNALALTDAKGAVLERYDYDDYGRPVFLSADGQPLVDATGVPVNRSPGGNPFLFHGLFWDGDTGLYLSKPAPEDRRYNLFEAWPCRDYDPLMGRHLSRSKPSGCAAREKRENDYSFAGNNPWSRRKDEIGRHTPFHNRYGNSMRGVGNNPLYEAQGKEARNPLYEGKGREVHNPLYTGQNQTMRYLHAEKIVHRDLAARNILLSGRAAGGCSTITGIEMFRKILDYGEAGDTPFTSAAAWRGHRDVGGYRAGSRLRRQPNVVETLGATIREGGRTIGAGQVIDIIK